MTDSQVAHIAIRGVADVFFSKRQTTHVLVACAQVCTQNPKAPHPFLPLSHRFGVPSTTLLRALSIPEQHTAASQDYAQSLAGRPATTGVRRVSEEGRVNTPPFISARMHTI